MNRRADGEANRIRVRRLGAPAAAVVGLALLSGCGTDAQNWALLGAGLGALGGQALGGDTEATLLGAAIGGGAGYVVGNESDKGNTRTDELYDPKY